MKIPTGYYISSEQTEPEYDPGLDVNCPMCGESLQSAPIRTVSMMEDRSRSVFYRFHQHCGDALDENGLRYYDSLVLHPSEDGTA